MKWWRHLRTFVRTIKVRVKKKKAKNIRSFSLILQGWWYFWTKKKWPILTKKVTLKPNFFNPKFFRTFLYLIFLNKQNFPIKILRGDGLEAARMVGQMCIFSKELKTISGKQSFLSLITLMSLFLQSNKQNNWHLHNKHNREGQCFKLFQNSTDWIKM